MDILETPSCPLIELSGSPAERGRQYGAAAAGRILRGAAQYRAQIEQAGLSAAELAQLVKDYLPVIEGFDAAYVEEMRGIARGAATEFDHIVLLNARTEILKLAQRPDLRERLAAAAEPDGCTGVVVLAEATRDGALIHAQNWDWKAECAHTAVVLRIRNENGPDILTYTEAGGLARSGLNSAGIAVTANYLESDRDYRQIGVPLALIRPQGARTGTTRARHARRLRHPEIRLEQHDRQSGRRHRDRLRVRARRDLPGASRPRTARPRQSLGQPGGALQAARYRRCEHAGQSVPRPSRPWPAGSPISAASPSTM